MTQQNEGLEDLLSPAEHEAIADAGRLYTKICDIVSEDKYREQDLAEIRHHVHGIQHALMAQAAARAYPDLYRLRGKAGSWESD